jgi:hypothetical protein
MQVAPSVLVTEPRNPVLVGPRVTVAGCVFAVDRTPELAAVFTEVIMSMIVYTTDGGERTSMCYRAISSDGLPIALHIPSPIYGTCFSEGWVTIRC